jgi:hypothetical protein
MHSGFYTWLIANDLWFLDGVAWAVACNVVGGGSQVLKGDGVTANRLAGWGSVAEKVGRDGGNDWESCHFVVAVPGPSFLVPALQRIFLILHPVATLKVTDVQSPPLLKKF